MSLQDMNKGHSKSGNNGNPVAGFIALIIILVILYFVGSFVWGLISGGSGPKASETDISTIKATATTIPYDDLLRNNEQYVGKAVVYTGEIVQIVDDLFDKGYRISITPSGYGFWTDTVYVTYNTKERFLQDDIVQFYGKVRGIKGYDSLMGHVEIPEINAVEMTLVSS